MLNTAMHNDLVEEKMTRKEFVEMNVATMAQVRTTFYGHCTHARAMCVELQCHLRRPNRGSRRWVRATSCAGCLEHCGLKPSAPSCSRHSLLLDSPSFVLVKVQRGWRRADGMEGLLTLQNGEAAMLNAPAYLGAIYDRIVERELEVHEGGEAAKAGVRAHRAAAASLNPTHELLQVLRSALPSAFRKTDAGPSTDAGKAVLLAAQSLAASKSQGSANWGNGGGGSYCELQVGQCKPTPRLPHIALPVGGFLLSLARTLPNRYPNCRTPVRS
jgi:hypothetical protein